MASEHERCTDAPHDETATCRLGTLKRRSQLDFEIEFFERVLSRDPNYVEVLFQLGELFARKGCHRRALQVDLRLSQLRPQDPMVFYNLACTHAVLRHKVEALASLKCAVRLGYLDVEHLSKDTDLDSLRDDPEFRRVVSLLEERLAAYRIA